MSVWLVVKLGENLEYFILLGSSLLSCFLKLGLCCSVPQNFIGSCLWLNSTLRNPGEQGVVICSYPKFDKSSKWRSHNCLPLILGFWGRNNDRLASQSFPTGRRENALKWVEYIWSVLHFMLWHPVSCLTTINVLNVTSSGRWHNYFSVVQKTWRMVNLF